MPFKSIETKMKCLFKKHIFKADIINNKAQQSIATTGRSITKGLNIHQPAKWRVKKINNGKHKIPGTVHMFSHSGKGKVESVKKKTS